MTTHHMRYDPQVLTEQIIARFIDYGTNAGVLLHGEPVTIGNVARQATNSACPTLTLALDAIGCLAHAGYPVPSAVDVPPAPGRTWLSDMQLRVAASLTEHIMRTRPDIAAESVQRNRDYYVRTELYQQALKLPADALNALVDKIMQSLARKQGAIATRFGGDDVRSAAEVVLEQWCNADGIKSLGSHIRAEKDQSNRASIDSPGTTMRSVVVDYLAQQSKERLADAAKQLGATVGVD